MNAASIYQQLAEAVGAGQSARVVKIFELLADENEAKVLMAAAPPATIDEISEKSGLSTDAIEAMIEPLFKKGLLFKSRKPDAIRYYRVRHLLQMHDSTIVATDASQEMLDLWKEFNEFEFPEFSKAMEQSLTKAAVRVVPVNVSLQFTQQILAMDDVRSIVKNAKSLAVTNCTCRVVDGDCGKPLEVCMQVNRAADYSIERGTGRAITKEEAIDILRTCEEEGLVHVADNRKEVAHIICNCCEDCCINWPTPKAGVGKFTAPSRFLAKVDADACTGCEVCIDRCFFDAIHVENEVSVIDAEKCMGCGVCAVTCPTEAISLEEVRPAEFVPQ